MECQTAERQTIRISVRWLSSPLPREMGASGYSANVREFQGRIEEEQQQPYILVFLENCDDVLQEELRIEQRSMTSPSVKQRSGCCCGRNTRIRKLPACFKLV